MADMDQAVKRILQRHIAEILDQFFPKITYLSPLPTDVGTEKQLIMDGLYLTEYDEERCATNIEVQTETRTTLTKKLRMYGARIYVAYELETISIVLILTNNGILPDEWATITVGKNQPLKLGTIRIFPIAVYNLRADDMIKQNVLALLPMVPLMQGATPTTAVTAMHIIKAQIPEKEEQIVEASLLAIFIARQFGKQVALSIRRFSWSQRY